MTRVDAQTSGTFELAPGEARAADARADLGSGAVSADFTLPELGGGGGVWTAVELRSGDGDAYRARARVDTGGVVRVGFSRVDGGVEHVLSSDLVAGLRYAPGEVLHLQGSISGEASVELRARAWTGDDAPGWQALHTDRSADRVRDAGTVRAWAYLSSGATESVTVGYDDITASEDTPRPPTPTPTPSEPTHTAEPTPEPTPTPEPDTTPPATTITGGPTDGSTTTDRTVRVEFAADDPGARFECRLDRTAWGACTSPWTVRELSVGEHVVEVRAADSGGNVDPTPVRRAFTVRAAAPTPPVGGKPTAENTGVPAGTPLARHDGDLVITKAGTVVDRMDVRGFVIVRAPNVTIKRSVVRGRSGASNNIGLITNYGSPNLLVEDVDVKRSAASVWTDGVKGSNFTLRRVHVSGGVDSVKIHGDDVTIVDSLLEDTDHFASDPNQGGRETHNDGVQVLKGRDIVIRGNTIRGASNMAVYAAPEQGATSLTMSGNWLDDGHCTVKLADKGGHGMSVTARDNRFGKNRAVRSCVMYVTDPVDLAASGNVWEDGGGPIPILRGRD